MNEVKKIIEEFQNGKTDLEACSKALAEHIYNYKTWYGLGKLSMDSLHDFMVSYIPKLQNLIAGYNPEAGSFEGYLYANITMLLKIWKRKAASSLTRQNCLAFISRMGVEEEEYEYSMDESSCVCEAEVEPSAEQLRKIKSLFRPVTYKTFRHKAYAGLKYSLFSEKKAEIIKRTCLVLFAKCAYYADDSITEKISVITETPVEELHVIRQKIIEELEPKLRRIRKCQGVRDSSFYFRNKYIMEMKRLDENTYLSRQIEKKIQERSKMWEKKNSMLKESSYVIIPSNMAVSRVLGMNIHTVKYILNYAQKNMDNLSLKRYNKYYEDLFGKRQREQKAGNE